MSPAETNSPRLVLLIHGIRTRAEWQGRISRLISNEANTCVPLKYGFLDVLRFGFPFWFRKQPIRILERKIDDAVQQHEHSELVVVAHSFGTYAIFQLLRDKPGFRPDRVLLCGSIVPENERWDTLPNRPVVLNDCGTKDIWPVLAKSLTWGYGASGTFGFGSPGVTDRYHKLSHSDFFDDTFVQQYWVPWVQRGEQIDSEFEAGRDASPYWMSLLTVLPIKYFLILGLLLLAMVAVWPRNRTVILMDSYSREAIYSTTTRDNDQQTNAHDIEKLLSTFDLDIRHHLVSPTWSEYDRIRELQPKLVVMHLRSFDDYTTNLPNRGGFFQFLSTMQSEQCEFIIYSRSSSTSTKGAEFLEQIYSVGEELRGRVRLIHVDPTLEEPFKEAEVIASFQQTVRQALGD